ncbi:MAG: hypothetical protein WCF85_06775 [Rhodospirillaceae bacterium]
MGSVPGCQRTERSPTGSADYGTDCRTAAGYGTKCGAACGTDGPAAEYMLLLRRHVGATGGKK